MEELFQKWLIKRGNNGAAINYPPAINIISTHYSRKSGTLVNIYQLKDPNQIIQISKDYQQSGRFSEFGYEHHGRYRAAMNRYVEFFLERSNSDVSTEIVDEDSIVDYSSTGILFGDYSSGVDNQQNMEDSNRNINTLTYERDLQSSFVMDFNRFYPDYEVYNGERNGVEYPINGKRIDVLLQNIENKNLLIIELKSGLANYKVFGQISMYLGMLKEKFPDNDIEGVIIAAEFDDSIRYSVQTNPKIKLMRYRISLELEEDEI
jgi:hypothetical protein